MTLVREDERGDFTSFLCRVLSLFNGERRVGSGEGGFGRVSIGTCKNNEAGSGRPFFTSDPVQGLTDPSTPGHQSVRHPRLDSTWSRKRHRNPVPERNDRSQRSRQLNLPSTRLEDPSTPPDLTVHRGSFSYFRAPHVHLFTPSSSPQIK